MLMPPTPTSLMIYPVGLLSLVVNVAGNPFVFILSLSTKNFPTLDSGKLMPLMGNSVNV